MFQVEYALVYVFLILLNVKITFEVYIEPSGALYSGWVPSECRPTNFNLERLGNETGGWEQMALQDVI